MLKPNFSIFTKRIIYNNLDARPASQPDAAQIAQNAREKMFDELDGIVQGVMAGGSADRYIANAKTNTRNIEVAEIKKIPKIPANQEFIDNITAARRDFESVVAVFENDYHAIENYVKVTLPIKSQLAKNWNTLKNTGEDANLRSIIALSRIVSYYEDNDVSGTVEDLVVPSSLNEDKTALVKGINSFLDDSVTKMNAINKHWITTINEKDGDINNINESLAKNPPELSLYMYYKSVNDHRDVLTKIIADCGADEEVSVIAQSAKKKLEIINPLLNQYDELKQRLTDSKNKATIDSAKAAVKLQKDRLTAAEIAYQKNPGEKAHYERVRASYNAAVDHLETVNDLIVRLAQMGPENPPVPKPPNEPPKSPEKKDNRNA